MKTNMGQMLRNPDIQPSSDVIAKALGESNNAYIKFINEQPVMLNQFDKPEFRKRMR